MKKNLFLVLIAIAIFSCKSKSTATSSTENKEPITSTKLDRSSQVGIKGNWKITKVTFSGSDVFKVNSFQIADSKCFEGSTWTFISNNNKGTMSLTKSNCPSFSSPIVWSINKDGLFVLKIVESGTKAKNVTEGYLLKVANQTENSFELIDNVNIAGKIKEVTYQFEKLN